MTELRTQDQARLRKALRFLDDEAPIPPGLPRLAPKTTGSHPRPWLQRPWLVAGAAFILTMIVLTPLVFLSGDRRGGTATPPPLVTPTATIATTTTTTAVVSERIPLDGRPGDLGVESIDFITAIYPTSPEEHRVSAVWEALRHNVEGFWVESCMVAQGISVEMPRITADYVRRSGDMPDFELDARMGIFNDYIVETPAPPATATSEQTAAWQTTYDECSNAVEVKRSEQFDQVIGLAPSWWDIVREVNASPEMKPVTDHMLSCIADNGGPDVQDVIHLYSDQITMDATSKEDAAASWAVLAELYASCAGDYNRVRQSLLIPKRQQIHADYPNVLAQAREYFNEVVDAASVNTEP